MSTRSLRFLRIVATLTLGGVLAVSTSCTTTYDAYGRPQQSVDPGLAVAGVAAAGLVGYAIANNNDNHHHYYRPAPCPPPYYRGGGHYRGGYRY